MPQRLCVLIGILNLVIDMNFDETSTFRRRMLQGAAGALISAALPARAQGWTPTRPLQLIVAYSPGGQADTVARALVQPLGQRLGQPVIVDNKPGGATIIAAQYVAKSPPDGYTIFFTPQAALIQNKVLFTNLPYQPERDLMPLCTYGRVGTAIVVSPSLGVANLRELIAFSRQRPIAVGTAGIGSVGHIAVEALNKEFGAKLQHVAYKGEAPALQDVLGGHTPCGGITLANCRAHLQSGKLRAIGLLGGKRAAEFPDVPTLLEQGATSEALKLVAWQSLTVPGGTPRAIVDRLAGELRDILQTSDMERRLAEMGVEREYIGPDALAELYKTDLAIWTRMLTELGLKGSAG